MTAIVPQSASPHVKFDRAKLLTYLNNLETAIYANERGPAIESISQLKANIEGIPK